MMKKIIFGTVVGLSVFALATVAVAVAPIALGGHPVSPVRTPDGRVVRGPNDSLVSGNWSGYAVAQYQTGQSYAAASSTWIVPAVTAPAAGQDGYSSSWVGIGGYCLNAICSWVDNSLIQLGTEQDVISGVAKYYAWYEMLPQSEAIISGFAVQPGVKDPFC